MTFKFHFAVRLQVLMIPDVLVILQMVIIGVSSITLCSASRALCMHLFPTLCSLAVGGGASNVVIQSWRRQRIWCPFGVMLAHSVSLVSSSVSEQNVGAVSYWGAGNIGGRVLWTPRCGSRGSQVCNRYHTNNGPSKDLDSTHQPLTMPIILSYCHLHTPQRCSPKGPGDIYSSRMGRTVSFTPILSN